MNVQQFRTNRAQSFAFGGRTLAPNVVARAQAKQQFNNAFNRSAVVPFDVNRNWDRRHDHEWNHHHFRWGGNSWVLIDPYPYGYGYGYGYNYPYTNYDSGDDYVAADVTPSVEYGSSSDSLAAEVQDALRNEGYYRGVIDGDVGPQTRGAILAFQRSHRLPETGMIDTSLLDALGLR